MPSPFQSGAIGAGLGGILSLTGGLLSRRASKRNRKRLTRLIGATQARATQNFESARQRFLDAPTVKAGLDFLLNRFGDPLAAGGLGEEAQNRIRQAQAARGLAFGGSAVQQEASFLTRLAESNRRQLLPFLGQFQLQAEGVGEGAFNRTFAGLDRHLGVPQAQNSGDVLANVLQGTAGGFQAGIGIQQLLGQGSGLQPLQQDNAGVSGLLARLFGRG
jgi:hypothetical protein